MKKVYSELAVILADTYALYLKTQNYHWHVTGAQFKILHELFEEQYQELAAAVDQIAERILILGHHAPATFKEFDRLKRIKDGDFSISANEMISQLASDHQLLIDSLQQVSLVAEENKDTGTAALLSDRIAAHEKAGWMLKASQATE